SEARLRKLRDWAAVRQSKRLLVKPLLTELRLDGEYPAWADRTAKQARATRAVLGDALVPANDVSEPTQLVLDQIRAGGWRRELRAVQWAFEGGFDDVGDLVAELARRWAVRQSHRKKFDLVASLFGNEAKTDVPGPPAGPSAP